MKKYLSIVLVLAVLMVTAKITKADDGGPNTVFWVTDHKTSCVSIINPEAVEQGSFLVFDYSAKTGQARGKPWTVVEKGKCYEVEDGTEDVYLIKTMVGNEREVFSNLSLYTPTDSFSHTFCNTDYDCSTTRLGYSITPIYLGEGGSATTSVLDEVHFTGITANTLFPTKYDLGFPVTYLSSMTPDELRPVIDNKSFISLGDLYKSLAKQLTSTLQSCDSRIRTERQYSVDVNVDWTSLYIKNVIWRLANSTDALVQSFDTTLNQYGSPKGLTPPDIFKELELMGCKAAFGAFIQTHKADFNTIDRLAEEVIAEYPDVLRNSDVSTATIYHRNATDVAKILAFINSNTSSEVPVTTENVQPTVMDEPTLEKKTDMLLNSSNPFVRVYIWLPIVALLGLVIVIMFRKK